MLVKDHTKHKPKGTSRALTECNGIKAFIYCRTVNQSPIAINAQKLACIGYCKREGLTVAKVFADIDVAEPAIGPGLRNLIRACQTVGGNVRHLVLYPTVNSASIIRTLADALASPIIADGQPAHAIERTGVR